MDNLTSYVNGLWQNQTCNILHHDGLLLADSGTPLLDLNAIVHSGDTERPHPKLNQVLKHTDALDVPFLLYQLTDVTKHHESLLREHHFKYIGQVSHVVLKHADHQRQEISKNFQVKRVVNVQDLKVWCTIMEGVFGYPEGAAFSFFNDLSSVFFDPNGAYRLHLLSNLKGDPIAIALLFLPTSKAQGAGHYCWATQEAHRKKGAMTFLVQEMIDHAKDHGYQHSVAMCFDSSLNLAKHLGFKVFNHIDVFSNVEHKNG